MSDPSTAQNYKAKIEHLIQQGSALRADGSNGSWPFSSEQRYSEIFGWTTGVLSFVENLLRDSKNPYVTQISKQLDALHSYVNHAHVNASAIVQLLKSLKSDIEDGLILSLKNRYEAETFDDFLAHAEEYLQQDRKMESGVIAGVVFEDTIRKICQKHDIEGDNLEQLINSLKTEGIIQKTMASRCKTAASVRGTAAHANWKELDIGSVRDTVTLTRELLGNFLEK